MATQVAIRLGIDGRAEVKQGFAEMARDGQAALGTVEQAAEKSGAAIDRQTQRLNRMAAAARDAATAEQAQGRFNAALGVGAGSGKSARDSADVFIASGELDARAKALRATLDPLGAAQDRLNDELAEYQRLAAAGAISARELTQAQGMARAQFDASTAAIDRNSRGLSRNVVASRLNLARQGADVAVTAAMGMNPAMIAIQQGPQILDALATSGIKAQGSLLLMGGALTAAAAGVAILGAAWLNGEAGALQMERAVTGLGRTSGLTAEQLAQLADSAAEQGEISISSARDQAAAYVSTGRIGREVMVDLIALGKDYASVFGLEAEDATQALAKAMAEPDKAARELTRQIGLMDQKTLDHIDSLVALGKEEEAQKILLGELSEAVSGHAERLGEIENAWDAISRSISDAITKFGEWLYVTEGEKVAERTRNLERQISARDRRIDGLENGGYWDAVGAGMSGLAAMRPENREVVANRLRAENARAQAQLDGIRAETAAEGREAAAEAATARANQEAQAEDDREKNRPRTRRGRADTSARDAEREAREAQRRQDREEDFQASRAIELARILNDTDRVRILEDEHEVRSRTRRLIEDGMPAEAAATQAAREQAELADARARAGVREAQIMGDQISLEALRIAGDERSVQIIQDRVDLQDRIHEYLETGVSLAEAQREAEADMLALATARAEVMERQVASADREHQLTIARLRGDGRTVDSLEYDRRVEDRAREIESRLGMDYGEGVSAARRQIDEEIAAAATGARRSWLHSFASDIKQSGIKAALIEQFDTASDRFLHNLIDGLAAIDWTSVFGGDGAGGGFGKFLNTILGGGSGQSGPAPAAGGSGGFWQTLWGVVKAGAGFGGPQAGGVGANADGTDNWPGGLTWVGERGRELVNLPRGSQVFSAPASLTMANRTAAAGGAPVSVPITIMAQDVQSFRASKSQIAAQIARAVRAAQRVD